MRYTHKLTEDGNFGPVADERLMVRKYIVDSLKYWTEEYKLDGYRFDLIGMHHPETVDAIVEEVRAIRPDLTIYGEPWTGGGPIHFGKGVQRGRPWPSSTTTSAMPCVVILMATPPVSRPVRAAIDMLFD